MKTLLVLLALAVSASGAYGQNCTKNLRGETICSNGQTAAAYNPHTGNAAVAQKNPNGTTTTQTRYGGTATIAPPPITRGQGMVLLRTRIPTV
jgi:hypothetical protein